MSRVEEHPILRIPDPDPVTFYFAGRPLTARRGEVISSALFAHGIRIFGTHPHDRSPQGIFCANGQCAQCLVIADGLPVKACMVPVREDMKVYPLPGYPELPAVPRKDITFTDIQEVACDLLIVGAGPAGMGAALEAADAGLSVLLVDDKQTLGGKLVLQTHLFFGAANECYAGTRGVEIAGILAREIAQRPNIKVMTDSMAVGVFTDGKVGIVSGARYQLVTPKSLLVAAGAREKAIIFPGCDRPGVYGAGAFQTLLNRDLVRPSERLFIVGGGNVGLIAAYHALQAGITVVGLCEALPDVGGYWVHADKIRRLGVPIYTSTSIVGASGKDSVESVTVARVDEKWNIIPGTYQTYACDTLLIAVGLERVCELHDMAVAAGMDAHLAGDAEEIAEASAAMFSGRLAGRRIAGKQGKKTSVPGHWEELTSILKSKPGREDLPVLVQGENARIFPVLGCLESIPCNPCAEVCPQQALSIPESGGILPRADFDGTCTGCTKCVTACPGLAITLVDMTPRASGKARVTIPFELPISFKPGDIVPVSGWKGEDQGTGRVLEIFDRLGHSPCRIACPADVRAQGYIQFIRQDQYEEAIQLLRRDLPLPGVCGRVCYHPCETECVRKDVDEPVAICGLKRFVADWAREHSVPIQPQPVTKKEKIAVVGSGPAGLACANELSYRGYAVTVYEEKDKAGGLLRWGIPAYRLPENILDYELNLLVQQGIAIKLSTRVADAQKLMADGYSAVFLAPGALKAMPAGIPGEDLEGVHDMLTFLEQVKSGAIKRLSGTVCVIGGGNSALDSAQTALRLGASDVRILYRRSREQMPAHDREVDQALAEGVGIDFLVAPESITGEAGKVKAIELIRMKLGEPDASGRARPVPIPGSKFTLKADHVILAIGQQPAFDGLAKGLILTKWGTIQADDKTQATTCPGVFAGGDAVTGASTVVSAFGAGKRAAESIDLFLRGLDQSTTRHEIAAKSPACWSSSVKKAARAVPDELPPRQRSQNFDETVRVLSEEAAQQEAARCLGCGALSECLPGTTYCERNSGLEQTSPILDHARLVILEVDPGIAAMVASIRVQDQAVAKPIATVIPPASHDDVILCRCERVTVGEVRRFIRQGVTDMNQLKALLHIGMGACGSKTCGPLIHALFRREGIARTMITPFVPRPLTTEVPMGYFAGTGNLNVKKEKP
ncbi:MAG TPA: FAD-dependent oxidoreductase [bacterium]